MLRIARALPVPPRFLAIRSAYRAIGARRAGDIGAGLLRKPGREIDFTDAQPRQYSAVWCLRGAGTYVDSRGERWPLRQGSLFHRYTDRRHSTSFEPGCDWAEAFIALSPELAGGLFASGVIDPRRPVCQPGLDLAMLADLAGLIDALERAPEHDLPRLAARLIALLVDLCGRDQRTAADPHAAVMETACRRLADEPRLDLARLARELGLSYERFRKVFRAQIGVAPGDYRIRRRIERARMLLSERALTVKAIAERLGYPNPFAFSAQFKQVVGESPEAFRRRH